MSKNNKDNQYLLDINLSELNKDYLIKEGYKYCLIYYLNDLVFGDIDKIEEIKKDILIEGFFFNEKQELHAFKNEDFEDEQNDGFKLVKTILYYYKDNAQPGEKLGDFIDRISIDTFREEVLNLASLELQL